MLAAIKHAIENGKLVLLLGAGASANSLDRQRRPLLTSDKLAALLAETARLPYSKEPLPIVYAAVKAPLGDRLWPVLEERFKHCTPSGAYSVIARFPWPRVYTLNIDDAFQTALRNHSPQLINVRYRFDRVTDRHSLYEQLDYIKLNGCIHRQPDGLIFSPQEYGAAAATRSLWYEELAEDYFRYTFLFIGTRLNEPLFFHQVERYRRAVGATEGTSFVLTRDVTEIEKQSLASLNLQHIQGTIGDFATWLQQEFPDPPSCQDYAIRSFPQLQLMVSRSDKAHYAKLFEQILPVRRDWLTKITGGKVEPGKVREFYRGFKPTWLDVLDDVPARLDKLAEIEESVTNKASVNERLFVIYGQAGSGKTTALMQLGLSLNDKLPDSVYFLLSPTDDLCKAIEALEASNEGRFFFLIDRLSHVADQIKELLIKGRLTKCILICTESQKVWLSRLKGEFGRICADDFKLELINEDEAERILHKLKQFGPWTRLGRMSQRQCIDELTGKARRQLLIGLLEATSGIGFEKIIRNDYESLSSDAEKRFLLLVGLGTIHHLSVPEVIVSRALWRLGITETVPSLLNKLSGIVHRTNDAVQRTNNDALAARHPVYIEHLFESAVSAEEKALAIHALLTAYTVYPSPVRRHVSRAAGQVFKFTLNHKFLKRILDNDSNMILSVYENFQKYFENDGLFWLQFGLALRDQGKHPEALGILKTAVDAYCISHTEHAYAQQMLILASIADSKRTANALVEEAKSILLRLDNINAEVGNEYPIVTLSELHTGIARRFDGEDSARALAKQYIDVLTNKLRRYPKYVRMRSAKEWLAKYAVTGVWEPPTDED